MPKIRKGIVPIALFSGFLYPANCKTKPSADLSVLTSKHFSGVVYKTHKQEVISVFFRKPFVYAFSGLRMHAL
ncbi:hypothetical protein EBQ90_11105 [bacterium]|nr:hypothetical protein [bacterium]